MQMTKQVENEMEMKVKYPFHVNALSMEEKKYLVDELPLAT